MHGFKSADADYIVVINGKVIDNSTDELFSFITSTTVHGSYSISISVNTGFIIMTHCTATYPAIFNDVNGTATMIQPIAEPVAVIKNGELKTVPFEITINADENFSYEHLLINGPTRLIISTEGKELFPGVDIDVGNFIDDQILDGILDIQAVYEYQNKPNDCMSKDDLKQLKEIVLKNATVM